MCAVAFRYEILLAGLRLRLGRPRNHGYLSGVLDSSPTPLLWFPNSHLWPCWHPKITVLLLVSTQILCWHISTISTLLVLQSLGQRLANSCLWA